jgi:hypothetical protein
VKYHKSEWIGKEVIFRPTGEHCRLVPVMVENPHYQWEAGFKAVTLNGGEIQPYYRLQRDIRRDFDLKENQ